MSDAYDPAKSAPQMGSRGTAGETDEERRARLARLAAADGPGLAEATGKGKADDGAPKPPNTSGMSIVAAAAANKKYQDDMAKYRAGVEGQKAALKGMAK